MQSDPDLTQVHCWSKPPSIARSAVHYYYYYGYIITVACAPYVLPSPLEPTTGSTSSLHDVKQHIVHDTLPRIAFKGAIRLD